MMYNVSWTMHTTWGRVMSCNTVTSIVSVLGHFLLMALQKPQRVPQQRIQVLEFWKCLKGHRLGWMEMSRLYWCSGCSSKSRTSSQRGSVDWCVYGVPASVPTKPNSKCLYSSVQSNTKFSFEKLPYTNNPHTVRLSCAELSTKP